jgi:hypothetical protein
MPTRILRLSSNPDPSPRLRYAQASALDDGALGVEKSSSPRQVGATSLTQNLPHAILLLATLVTLLPCNPATCDLRPATSNRSAPPRQLPCDLNSRRGNTCFCSHVCISSIKKPMLQISASILLIAIGIILIVKHRRESLSQRESQSMEKPYLKNAGIGLILIGTYLLISYLIRIAQYTAD